MMTEKLFYNKLPSLLGNKPEKASQELIVWLVRLVNRF